MAVVSVVMSRKHHAGHDQDSQRGRERCRRAQRDAHVELSRPAGQQKRANADDDEHLEQRRDGVLDLDGLGMVGTPYGETRHTRREPCPDHEGVAQAAEIEDPSRHVLRSSEAAPPELQDAGRNEEREYESVFAVGRGGGEMDHTGTDRRQCDRVSDEVAQRDAGVGMPAGLQTFRRA